MFRVPYLRKKVLFTIFIIFIFRIGSYVPAPVLDFNAITDAEEDGRDGCVGFLDLFSGEHSPACAGIARGSCRTSRRRSSCNCSVS